MGDFLYQVATEIPAAACAFALAYLLVRRGR